MCVRERESKCLFGRREWKTGCGQDVVVVKTNEEKENEKSVYAVAKNNFRTFLIQKYKENRLHVFHFVILTINNKVRE